MPGSLDGVRIVDLTSVVMGPYTTQILGDYGADIIKVEAPSGDTTRQLPPMRNPAMGTTFLQMNRNKRSIVLDLKQPTAVAALREIVKTADVFVSNIRPRALARLGLAPEGLLSLNPRLVVASLVGFGQDGPYAADPAYDDLIQGLTAVPAMLVAAGSEAPHYVPLAYNDRAVGLSAAVGILAALHHRDRTGEGQAIEVPMFETMVQSTLGDHMGGLTFEPPLGPPGYLRSLNPERRPYPTKDGYVCAVIYTDRHWRAFTAMIGQPSLLDDDERFTDLSARTVHAHAVYGLIRAEMPSRTTQEWLTALREGDIPATPLHTLETIVDDPHLVATDFFRVTEHPSEGLIREMAVPTKFSATPAPAARPAPRLGQHSVEILREAGLAEGEIEALVSSRATVGS
ncbi:MAG: CoA transferase [Pseudonocardiales bacterium]|nr:CoA transferase [Pseudonocardiales bacterium]